MGRFEILGRFGFVSDPFAACSMETADGLRVRNILAMATTARAQVAVIGERGVGKSRAVAEAVRRMRARVVRVLSADKGRITAGDIQEAMILDLCDETPRRTKEVRVRQLRRVLGEASRKQPVVVLIEESHRLHPMTLRSLKNLRELDWMGETQLFTVVLVGQSDCTQRAGLAEVRLRTEAVQMHGLTQGEVTDYVRGTVGKVFTAEASQVVGLLPEARNFLDLQELLIHSMESALAAGREQVSAEDVGSWMKASGRTFPSAGRQEKGAGAGAALKSVLDRRKGQRETAPEQSRDGSARTPAVVASITRGDGGGA